MPQTTTNIHFRTDESLCLSGMSHGRGGRSVNICAQEYGGVSLFITKEQAAQIADHFRVLVETWDVEVEHESDLAAQDINDGGTSDVEHENDARTIAEDRLYSESC